MAEVANLRISFYSKLISAKELFSKYKEICKCTPKAVKHKILSLIEIAKYKIAETVENALHDFCNHTNLNIKYQKRSNKFDLNIKFTLEEFEDYCKETGTENIIESKTHIINFTNKVADICFMDYSKWLEEEVINLAKAKVIKEDARMLA